MTRKITDSPSTQITQSKKEDFVKVYKETMGHISDTCASVGISRKTYYNWLDNDDKFRDLIIDAECDLNDEIRQVLIDKAANGDMAAVIFYLKKRHPDFKDQSMTVATQVNIELPSWAKDD